MDDTQFSPSPDESSGPAAEEWLTPQEIALELKVNQQSVRNWLRDKTLVGAKFGDVWRVRRSEYERFVAEAVRRGQRFELNDELAAFLKESGYQALDAYGDANEVEFYVDLNPIDRTRNEIGLRSHREKRRPDAAAPEFEGSAWIEDSDEQPYEGLVVQGATHTEVFLKLLHVIRDLDRRQAALKNTTDIDSERSEA